MNQSTETKAEESEEIECTRMSFQNFELSEMEDTMSTRRRWEDMELDVLVKIFLSFNIVELTSGVSRVCSSWRLACCDPILWKTIDFTVLQSKFIKIPSPPYVWVAGSFDRTFTRTLKVAFSLSRGIVHCLIFHSDLYMNDNQLAYVAERTPHLKRLVLPAWNRITKGGICKAVRNWPELESLTMPSIKDPGYILEEIAINCNNFSQLKIMGTFDIAFARNIYIFIPKLKVLSLRCSPLYREAVDLILDNLECLEVLNISHCLFVEKLQYPLPPRRLSKEIHEDTVKKASRLSDFFTCQEKPCVLCKLMIIDDGYIRWYKCEEGMWRKDEVSSLAC